MSFSCRLTGDWGKLGIVLQRLSASLFPLAKVRLEEDGQMVLEKLQGHIDNQDLNWADLQPLTIKKKNSNTVYVETGTLRNEGFEVRKLSTSPRGTTLYIGPKNVTHTPSGLKMTELMIYLEYGTAKIPPRPLIRPTWAEVEPLIKENLRQVISDLIK